MHGQIHDCLRCLLLEMFGKEAYEKLLEAAKVDDSDHFLKFIHYDDSVTLKMLTATSEVLEKPLLDVLEAYGVYWVKYIKKFDYSTMLYALGPNIRYFLENVDTVHTLLSDLYDNIVPPMYRCEQLENGDLNLHYLTFRQTGLQNLALGIIKGAGKHMYNTPVDAEVVEVGEFVVNERETLRHAVIHVTLPEHQRKMPTLQRTINDMCAKCRGPMPRSFPRPVMTLEDFCILFPYQVIFDTDMVIKVCGDRLQAFCPAMIPGRKLTETCDLIYPRVPFTIEQFVDCINVNFIVQVLPCERSAGLRLKGQMIPINKDHFIFVCSPQVKNLDELLNRGIYLADLPIYDSTRQFVMLNQVRHAEVNISAQLEETTAELKITHEELEQERAKTNALICEMLPRKVADMMKTGIKTPPEKFRVVTILFSNIVNFCHIAANVEPMEVVHLLNTIYSIMDLILAKHNVYKVETVGSTYMVVGGAPVPCEDHAEQIANMALDMEAAAETVQSPLDGSVVQMQLGIHSGPIVAAIIGEKMPRYCLFGDTVNVSSRMMSTSSAGRINVSPKAFIYLHKAGYVMDDRGILAIKGKGNMHCYFLLGGPECQKVPLTVPAPPETTDSPSS